MTERTGQVHDEIVSMFLDVLLAALDGRLEEAVDMARRTRARGDEAGVVEWTLAFLGMVSLRPRLHLRKADDGIQPWVQAGIPSIGALCLAYLGRHSEVVEILERRVLARPDIGSAEDEAPAWEDILFLEAAVMVGHREAADLLLRRLAGSNVHTSGMQCTTCAARHLGAAAALLGRPEEARAHYQDALKVATEMRFRPEVALTRLQVAELLLEHYPDEKSEALEHLDFAINEFRDMKMQPSLERALKHKEILGA